MKKYLLPLILVMLSVGIINAQNQGYHWEFGTVPPVASAPAIQGSTGSYTLTTLGGAADVPVVTTHNIISKSVGKGTSCTAPIMVDSIDAPSGLEFSNSPQFVNDTWTIELTVNFSTPPGDYRRLLGFDNLTGALPDADYGIYLEAITGEIILFNGTINYITGGAVTPGNWNHLAFTRNDVTDVISYYRDGVLIGSLTDGANTFVPKASNSNKINFFKDNGTEESNVEIAKLSIYNRVLTESEIFHRTFNNICNTTHQLASLPNEGHQWVFPASAPPFTSSPAVTGSTAGAFTLTSIGGGAITTGTSESLIPPPFGASCTATPVDIALYPTDAGLEFGNSPRYIYDTYTIELAINFAALGTVDRKVVGFYSLGTLPAATYGIYVNTAGNIDFYNGASNAIAAAPTFTTNTWYHVVFVRAASGIISYYRNGALVGTYNDAAGQFIPQSSNGNDITFFKDDNGTNETSGKLAKIGIFNAVLSADDVLERFDNICNTSLVLLPVSLKSFTAVKADKQVQLTWTTASEENNLGFEVQRSSDGTNFTTIGFVNGNGTTAQENTYHFTDQSPFAGKNYYRLKQIDIDNRASYSSIRSIEMDKDQQRIQLFPNPSRSLITVTNIKAGDQMSVFNSQGNLILRKIASSGRESISVEKLAAGVYMLQVTDSDNNQRTIRFSKF